MQCSLFFATVASTLLLSLVSAQAPVQERKFSRDLLVGNYGRILQLVGSNPSGNPCSATILHGEKGTRDERGDVFIPRDSISHSGETCGTGAMILRDTPRENIAVGIGKADEIFMKVNASDGFWLGKESRTCGRWTLPDPTALFMVFDEQTELPGPFGITLAKGQKFLFLTNAQYTCVYRGIPLPTARPIPAKTKEPEAKAPVSEEQNNGSVCFPGHATVQLEGGRIKPMSDVSVGDRVHVGQGKFSEVFMFTHKLTDVEHEFVNIKVSSGETVTLTRGHYLYKNGALAAAKTVAKGDVLYTATASTVVSVYTSRGHGLFNPQTVHGDIVVNGILCSTFTTAVDPHMAQGLLAPVRALYTTLGLSVHFLHNGASAVAEYMPTGLLSY